MIERDEKIFEKKRKEMRKVLNERSLIKNGLNKRLAEPFKINPLKGYEFPQNYLEMKISPSL